jgi:thiol-disulfide isomerase/thioredoxin
MPLFRPFALALTTCAVLLAAGASPALAQATKPAAMEPTLSGSSLEGQPFKLSELRGKVVMLFFWNTDCVPCIQKMPELRANAMGWKAKPFEMVLISTDRDRASALSYLQTLRKIEKDGPQAMALWSRDLSYGGGLTAPATVPLTLVIDAKGHVVARHAGRIAPEAWDDVAALLP